MCIRDRVCGTLNIPKVRELNFWREEEEDEESSFLKIFPYKKQEKTLIKGPCPRRSVERINRNHYKQMPRKKIVRYKNKIFVSYPKHK